jgi:hypothetical protein
MNFYPNLLNGSSVVSVLLLQPACTRWTDEARAAEFMARSLFPISVSIDQDPVITHPASIIAFNCASHPEVDL